MSKVPENFTTKKGTVLPLLNLKGKPYMQAQHRLVWFVEENPFYHIKTQIVQQTPDSVIMQATVTVLDNEGRPLKVASDYKTENVKGFADFVEKSATGAVSRCLLQLGYGTAFAGQELDEGLRLADSPMMPATFAKSAPVVPVKVAPVKTETAVSTESSESAESGSFSNRRRRKVEPLIEVQDDGI